MNRLIHQPRLFGGAGLKADLGVGLRCLAHGGVGFQGNDPRAAIAQQATRNARASPNVSHHQLLGVTQAKIAAIAPSG
jgi:hypothetical protein